MTKEASEVYDQLNEMIGKLDHKVRYAEFLSAQENIPKTAQPPDRWESNRKRHAKWLDKCKPASPISENDGDWLAKYISGECQRRKSLTVDQYWMIMETEKRAMLAAEQEHQARLKRHYRVKCRDMTASEYMQDQKKLRRHSRFLEDVKKFSEASQPKSGWEWRTDMWELLDADPQFCKFYEEAEDVFAGSKSEQQYQEYLRSQFNNKMKELCG